MLELADSGILDEGTPDQAVQLHCASVRTMLYASGCRYGVSPAARARALSEAVELVPEAVACGLSVADIADLVGVTRATLEGAIRRHDAERGDPRFDRDLAG